MINYKKLAKALRLEEVTEDIYDPRSKGQYWRLDGKLVRKPQVMVDPLVHWLNSPEGEKVVREKVRELWQSESHFIAVEYRNGQTDVCLMECVPHGVEIAVYVKVSNDESEAWQAALLWLVEMGSK